MGGVERSTTLLIRHLDRLRFEPLLVCPQEPEIQPLVDEVRGLGVCVTQSSLISTRHKSASPRLVVQLVRMFRSLRIDILHIQVLGGEGARHIKLAARLAGIPVIIVTLRGATLRRLRGYERAITGLIDRAAAVHTVASYHNRKLQIENIGRKPDSVRVVYNAIDIDPFDRTIDRGEARRRLGLPDGPIVGTIARIEHQKGLTHFVQMASLVKKSVSDARFVIIGNGTLRDELSDEIQRHGMQDCIFLPGYRRDVAHCLAAMDVFVLSSVFEPFGLVLAEAMAMERPVVATNVGGIPEVVEDGVTGTLVAPADGPALACAVMAYIQDPDLGLQHGRAGRRRVEACFSIARLIREMEELYDEEIRKKQ